MMETYFTAEAQRKEKRRDSSSLCVVSAFCGASAVKWYSQNRQVIF
jgi:hypothetical protein